MKINLSILVFFFLIFLGVIIIEGLIKVSFSLKQINRDRIKDNKKVMCNKEDIRKCFGIIQEIHILTKDVNMALQLYVRYRLKTRGTVNLSPDTLLILIEELLENCCGKPYVELSRQDISNNENTILKQIKNAVLSGSTRHIYQQPGRYIVDTTRLRDSILSDNNCNTVRRKNTYKEVEDIRKYFEDLRV